MWILQVLCGLDLMLVILSSQPCDQVSSGVCQCGTTNCTVTGATELTSQWHFPSTISTVHVTESSIDHIVESIRLTAVKKLFLSDCHTRFLGDYIFKEMGNLTDLILSNNTITSLSDKTFNGLTALTHLDLANNNFYRIQDNVFSNSSFPQLKVLTLRNCSIYDIKSKAIHGLSKLLSLDASYNELLLVPWLDDCSKLKRILLSHNSIYDLSGTRFAALNQLEIIDLAHNEITQISHETFKGLASLNDLRLSHNSLTSLGDAPFSSMPALSAIDVSRNRLTTLREDLLTQPKLQIIKLYDNPWNCDCEIFWMRNDVVVREFNQPDGMKCDQPKNVENQSIYMVDEHTFDCPDDHHGMHSNTVALALGILVALVLIVLGSVFFYKYVSRKRVMTRYSGSPSSGSPYSRVLFVGDSGNI